MANEPDVWRIKQEKRAQRIEPAPAGMTRRRFLTFLGAGSAALAAGSTGVLTGCAESTEEGPAAGSASSGGGEAPFSPIAATDADEVVFWGASWCSWLFPAISRHG